MTINSMAAKAGITRHKAGMDGVVLRALIWNWIDGKGQTTHINH